MKHDTKSILKTFYYSSFYSNLAGDLLAKLPKSPNQYTIKFVSDYYKKISLAENFRLYSITEGYQFNILKTVEVGSDDGLVTGMIFIELQKAFDTINYDILLKKLSIISFSNQTVKWFQSYLWNRKFTINLENSFSEVSSISCGVPQGSILGSLLFLIYANDIPMAVKCDLFLYADDTCLVFQSKNVKDIEKQLNKDFANICDWFVDNN